MPIRFDRAAGAGGYVVAVGAAALAVLLRWLADPWMGDHFPFITLYAAVAVAVFYGGYRAALVAMTVGYLACDWLFIDPRGSFVIGHVRDYIGLGLYVFSSSIIIAFGNGMRAARKRAEVSRQEALDQQRRLEQEAGKRLTAEQANLQMAAIVESSDDAIISKDPNGMITSWNRGAEKHYGYTADEIVGRPISLLVPPDQTDELPGIMERLQRHEQIEPYETVRVCKDGRRLHVSVNISPIRNEAGAIVGASSIARDITLQKCAEEALRESEARLAAEVVEMTELQEELRRAEERIRSVVDHIVDGIITIDEKGTVESFNPAAEKLFGYRTFEVIGQNVKMLMPAPYHGEHDNYIANYLRTGEAKIIGIGREVVGRRKDGSTFPMELAVSEFRLNQGRYFTGMVRDITERRRAEEELRRAVDALKEADRRKDDFMATLAHELRNPLAPIRNAVNLLPTARDRELEWCREVIDRQVQQMARLLEDLLDVSRISHNRLELRKQRLELAAVVESAVEISRPLIDAGGHDLTVELPPEPISLDADPVRLAQVFSNLLNNAAKYTDKSGRIELSAERQGSDVVVSVKDTGIGIVAEMLPRIFEIFSQATPALERSQGGLGIGLSLVRGLVELHGGMIEARSEGPRRGSEFVVRLPIVLQTMPDRPAATGVATSQTSVVRRRLLIVDDLKDSADSLAMLLRLSGHEVHTAYDGEQAVEAAGKLLPQVVLLDIGMPKLNGYDACRRIREQPWGKTMYLIALTGWGQAEDVRRTEEAGFNRHLVKPVDAGQLLQLLAEWELSPA